MALNPKVTKHAETLKAFATKHKKGDPVPVAPSPEPSSKSTHTGAAAASAQTALSNSSGVAKALRTVVSVHPSELKAVVAINGKKHKVVYHLKGAEPMIGLPEAGSVKLVDWLQGKADLSGL